MSGCSNGRTTVYLLPIWHGAYVLDDHSYLREFLIGRLLCFNVDRVGRALALGGKVSASHRRRARDAKKRE